MFKWLFGDDVVKIDYAIFVHMINDRIITLEEQFDDYMSEETIADIIMERNWIKSESALYTTDQIVSITVRTKTK